MIKDNIKSKIEKTKSFYEKYERYIPILSFFAGFTWDSLTLTRIDQLMDSLILFLYLMLLGVAIVLMVFVDKGIVKTPLIKKYSEWFPAVIQFFLGGLFSTYVVFYFQSASFTRTSLFVILLVGLLVANEFLHKKLKNLFLLLSLYFFAGFSFFIFFLPVLFKVMSIYMFFLAGFISVSILFFIIYLFKKYGIFETIVEVKHYSALIVGIFLFINLFYFLNWIPPVPLSMKSAGIYHHVHRSGDYYILKHEEPKWYQVFKTDDSDFNYADGDSVYCYAAVFAPTNLSEKIYHQWQVYSIEKSEWITSDKRGYELRGGREGGYRGYTMKKNVKQGEWRVNIITEDNLLLGTINFDIISDNSKQRVWEIIKME
jgi:DUF2914 family protein